MRDRDGNHVAWRVRPTAEGDPLELAVDVRTAADVALSSDVAAAPTWSVLRLIEILNRDFTVRASRDAPTLRIAEAQREGWLGEVEGLQVSLVGAEDKLAQLNCRSGPANNTTDLGTPTVTDDS